jgi:hypothetical protein
MRKPNYARVEAVEDGEVSGVLVLDGENLWVYWTKERPMFYPGDESEEAWKKTCFNAYMKKPAPPGQHSIQHEAGWWLGLRSILEPSVFHGYAHPMEPYMDGVRSIGTERVGDEACDGIEVSFMDHQRSWYLWLSRRDHVPRRLQQHVRLSRDQIMEEVWSDVVLNAPIPEERFTWTPPPGWREWRPLSFEETLLKPGTQAPDFSLKGLDGESTTLSSYRGNVVWLAIWRAG